MSLMGNESSLQCRCILRVLKDGTARGTTQIIDESRNVFSTDKFFVPPDLFRVHEIESMYILRRRENIILYIYAYFN